MPLPDLKSDKGRTLKEGSLKPKDIDKLSPGQRAWSNDVMRALGLKSTSSQARVLAGAIASAQVVDANGTPQEKQAAKGLRATVINAGTPPWKDARSAMAAGDAKVNLDLLSIPAAQRTLQPLDASKKGVNQSFWINRRDALGNEQRSFLCKPASPPARQLENPLMPSGGRRGGEVAREALTGRAAQFLQAQTGIDVGMPETHVVKLAPGMVPGADPNGGDVSCSVQEARDVKGDLRDLTAMQLSTLAADEVAGIAILDTLTLNGDRHSGNVMVGTDGKLVPIDHGESFAEDNDDGIKRIRGAMGTPHNALLKIPNAHAPMSQAMLKKLKAFSATDYASSLAKDNDDIGDVHADMKDAVSAGAIENARRAARFVKLAARNDPPLSPASIQVAMGNSAEVLFGPAVSAEAFEAAAQRAISRMAPHQGTVKEVCTAPNVEYKMLADKLKAPPLRWDIARRHGEPTPDTIADPVTMLTILQLQISMPARQTDIEALLKDIQNGLNGRQPLTPDQATTLIERNRRDTIDALLPLMNGTGAADIRSRLQALATRKPDERGHLMSMMLPAAIKYAMEKAGADLATLVATHRLQELKDENIVANYTQINGWAAAEAFLEVSDPIGARQGITNLGQYAAQGAFIPASCTVVRDRLRKLAETLMIDDDDADLTQGFADAQSQDPIAANARWKALIARQKNGEFQNGPLAQLQGELDYLRNRYTIAPTEQHLVAAQNAHVARDPILMAASIRELRSAANRGELAPSDAGLQALAATWDVPEDDLDLIAATNALTAPDIPLAKTHTANLKRRYKAGEFGSTGLDAARDELNALTDTYNIPVDNSDLIEATGYLLPAQNDPAAALPLIARLQSLARSGVFIPKLG